MGAVVSASIFCCAAIADAGEVRLWPTASVSTEFVVLRDVAAVSGFDAETTARLDEAVVYGSPRVGTELMIRIDEVREALTEAGFNLANVSLMGSSRCRVTRLGGPKPARATVKPKTPDGMPPVKKYRPRLPEHKPIGARSISEAKAASWEGDERWRRGEAGQTLESVLRRHIASGFSSREGRVEIRFSPTSLKALATAIGGEDRVRIRNRDERRLGLVSFEIELERARGQTFESAGLPVADLTSGGGYGENKTGNILVSAEVVLVKDVVVARRPINQSQLISGRDLMLEERRFDGGEFAGLEDLAAAVGQQSKHFIRQGEIVEAKALESKPLVRRGDLVKIIVSGGGVEIQATGQAQASGALGELIAVRRDGSRRKQELIDATVVGPGLVSFTGPRRVASREE